jgi:ribosomal protein L40E
MKKCEYCGRENDDAATACAECTTEFPSASPRDNPEEQPLRDPALDLATVATFRNPMDAGMFKARLEAAGIEACVPEEYTPHIFWNTIPSPLEHVTVRVAAKDYEAAKELLRDYADHSITVGLPAVGGPETERQGSEQLRQSAPDRPCVACGVLIPANANVCPKCGHTQLDWKA